MMKKDKNTKDRSRQGSGGKSGTKGKRMWILVLVLAVLVGIGGYYSVGLSAPEPGNAEEVTVEIPEGSSLSAIVDILDEAGLVRNRLCAKIHSRIGNYDIMQANTYVFSRNIPLVTIMKAISTGDINYLSTASIEIRDGERLEQLAAAMEEQLPFSAEEIMNKWNDREYVRKLIDKYWFLSDEILDDDVMYPLEGYLYADTYLMTTDNSTIESFTEMCLDRMDEALKPRRKAISGSGFSVHEFLTLTSIVTKEASAADQPKVAGVFMNRLDKDISLGSDVTVCYIFQEDRVELRQSQLDSDSHYNTRRFKGLPPGPICQMVDSAMDAVLEYKKSDDLFFFADEDGVVHYYKTQEDFEQGIEDNGLLKDEENDGEGGNQ